MEGGGEGKTNYGNKIIKSDYSTFSFRTTTYCKRFSLFFHRKAKQVYCLMKMNIPKPYHRYST
jgi:hypothetical protein